MTPVTVFRYLAFLAIFSGLLIFSFLKPPCRRESHDLFTFRGSRKL